MLEKEGPAKAASAIANLISSLYTFYFISRNTYEVYETFYKSVWGYFEIIYFALNMTVSVVLIANDGYMFSDTQNLMDVQDLRIIESFLAIIIFMKLLYFMQIVD